MSVNRLILLALMLGGLTLFLVQNWSLVPPQSITLLTIQTRPLPLAVWILFSLFAGAGISALINSLLQLSGYFARGQYPRQSSVPNNSRSRYENTDFKEKRGSRSSNSSPFPEPEFQRREYRNYTDKQEYRDDWENPIDADDWGFEENYSNSSTRNYTDTTKSETRSNKSNQRTWDNEREWEPEPPKTRWSDSDSSYSDDSSQETQTSTNQSSTNQSIYDADYRVIVPPNQSSKAPQDDTKSNKPEDDWGFLEEDEFEIDKNDK